MPLPVELALQIFVIFLVIIDVAARPKEEHKVVAKLTTATLALLGFGLTIFTIARIIRDWSTLDPHALVNELLLPVWLTIAAIPCIYFIAVYMGYESLLAQMRFWNDFRRPSARAILGVISALKASPIDINGFRGLYAKRAARARSFGEARRAVRDFRDDRAADRVSKADARQRLITYAGVSGVNSDGLTLDRREFAETKQALRWLATCHMGWYQRDDRPNKYRSNLLSVLDDFSRQGLPGDHGIVMKVRKNGQAWYAFRTTPSGHVFGIGAVGAPPSQWFYDGVETPKSYPSTGSGWRSFMEPDRPEWREEPETE
jgi:hypothetical protein